MSSRTFTYPAASLHSILMHCVFSKIMDENVLSVNRFILPHIYTLFTGWRCMYILWYNVKKEQGLN